ncbi:hypothetical protein BW12_07130 [Bifidobacterium sp. UTCIF-3]|uniref:hypothetical protein n=1 Tax=unclassified Bifidobacterium TaxID=2608897 RepID=UPI00112D45C5|nr:MULTISPECIES: hypothetical protein [unclassified Bifidobacterium]TPF78340.1 hypothetical protein BW09_04615 [Bifidobacterium sp. UTCIF-1]TPF81239.1 hypothetical protein BW08_00965 [Bifidobacterium sp. UTCIF-24]TPF82020.1 hypothetical protein BW12_07130 [Bifidobacterium sp. UTCIF-3]TPF85132.1 hypothetical protein BW07_00220 [Bifidobacterium sp. UTCIF-36]
MGALSVTGLKTGTTSLDITAGSISKTIPVTVKSSNLLAYGPASGNNLTVSVAADGSLDMTSSGNVEPGKGVIWTWQCPDELKGADLVLSYDGSVPGVLVAEIMGDGNNLATIWQGSNDKPVHVPSGTKTLSLRVTKGGNTAAPVTGNLKIKLNVGGKPAAWMKPDSTNVNGAAS